MLGALRICQPHLDSRCSCELEPVECAQLCVCGRGLCLQRGVFVQEPVCQSVPPSFCYRVLTSNSYPVVSATDKKTSQILLVVVLALHGGLAIAIKILFFAHASPAAKTGSGAGDLPDPIGDANGDRMRFF